MSQGEGEHVARRKFHAKSRGCFTFFLLCNHREGKLIGKGDTAPVPPHNNHLHHCHRHSASAGPSSSTSPSPSQCAGGWRSGRKVHHSRCLFARRVIVVVLLRLPPSLSYTSRRLPPPVAPLLGDSCHSCYLFCLSCQVADD